MLQCYAPQHTVLALKSSSQETKQILLSCKCVTVVHFVFLVAGLIAGLATLQKQNQCKTFVESKGRGYM